jgi:benzoylformate decarboxylase
MSVYSEVDPMPDSLSMVQVGLSTGILPRNYGAEIALKADVKETLRRADTQALKAERRRSTRGAGEAWQSRRCIEELDRQAQGAVEQISKSRDSSTIVSDWLALQVVEAMPQKCLSWSTRV